MLALILALLALMSFLMMLVTLLIGVKLANELAAAEQAMSKRAAVSHPHYLPRSQPPAFLRPAPPCGPGLWCLRPVRCLME